MNEYWLSEEQFERLRPLLPTKVRGVARADDRRVISGIVHVVKPGGRWVDAPACYGPTKTLYNRFVRWADKGIWQDLLLALAAAGRPICGDLQRALRTLDIVFRWRALQAAIGPSPHDALPAAGLCCDHGGPGIEVQDLVEIIDVDVVKQDRADDADIVDQHSHGEGCDLRESGLCGPTIRQVHLNRVRLKTGILGRINVNDGDPEAIACQPTPDRYCVPRQ